MSGGAIEDSVNRVCLSGNMNRVGIWGLKAPEAEKARAVCRSRTWRGSLLPRAFTSLTATGLPGRSPD